jgi:cation diffusion facilitator family transporter
MHTHTLGPWTHEHVFLGARHDANERRTWWVVVLTAVMMVAEIVGGTIYGSMALVADGWHMSTHAGALAIAALAYRYARRFARDSRFAFGTGKLGELAGYSSALILAVIALLIAYESALRLLNPVAIRFDQAIVIACIGLAVNLVSAWLLHDDHDHTGSHEHHADHDHDDHHAHHDHEHRAHDHHGHRDHRDHHAARAHAHGHHDHNLRAAYLHVLADALTSVLAIAALVAGRFYGWVWLDPIMGVVGALVIAHWSFRLLRSSGAVLVDVVVDSGLATRIRERLEVGTDRVTDLHLWRVGPGHAALIASVVSDRPQAPEYYKARLAQLEGLSHVTIEVHPCPHPA